MEEKKSITAIHSKTCPVHHVLPLINIHNGYITVRCCCDLFTQQYITGITNELKGNTLLDMIHLWEKDLEMNELQQGE
jgi:hypothetical protein